MFLLALIITVTNFLTRPLNISWKQIAPARLWLTGAICFSLFAVPLRQNAFLISIRHDNFTVFVNYPVLAMGIIFQKFFHCTSELTSGILLTNRLFFCSREYSHICHVKTNSEAVSCCKCYISRFSMKRRRAENKK